MKTVTLIPGDGIGPEVMQAALRVIESAGIQLNWERVEAGAQALEKYGTVLPQTVVDSMTRNKIALKGPVGTPVGQGFQSVSVTLRKKLNLYANLRPIKSFPGTKSKYENIDKANIMKLSDGLFLECARRVSHDYPEIQYDELIVDNACMQLILNPHQFDVLLLENLYGDIVSDLCAGLIGGLGVAPGANIYRNYRKNNRGAESNNQRKNQLRARKELG